MLTRFFAEASRLRATVTTRFGPSYVTTRSSSACDRKFRPVLPDEIMLVFFLLEFRYYLQRLAPNGGQKKETKKYWRWPHGGNSKDTLVSSLRMTMGEKRKRHCRGTGWEATSSSSSFSPKKMFWAVAAHTADRRTVFCSCVTLATGVRKQEENSIIKVFIYGPFNPSKQPVTISIWGPTQNA